MSISPDSSQEADDLQSEYDFASMPNAVRGKYAASYNERLRIVRLADDIATAFPDEESVNRALRTYLNEHPVGGGA